MRTNKIKYFDFTFLRILLLYLRKNFLKDLCAYSKYSLTCLSIVIFVAVIGQAKLIENDAVIAFNKMDDANILASKFIFSTTRRMNYKEGCPSLHLSDIDSREDNELLRVGLEYIFSASGYAVFEHPPHKKNIFFCGEESIISEFYPGVFKSRPTLIRENDNLRFNIFVDKETGRVFNLIESNSSNFKIINTINSVLISSTIERILAQHNCTDCVSSLINSSKKNSDNILRWWHYISSYKIDSTIFGDIDVRVSWCKVLLSVCAKFLVFIKYVAILFFIFLGAYFAFSKKGKIKACFLYSLLARNEKNNVIPFFQPIIDSNSNLNSAEILSRWCKNGENVPPSAFISIISKAPLLLDFLLIRTIMDVTKLINDHNCELKFNFNVSPYQVESGRLFNIMSSLNIEKKHLYCFEITEDMSFKSAEKSKIQVERLKLQGYEFKIDDFGTGFTSYQQVEMLGMKWLKIDRSIIEIENEEKRKAVLSGFLMTYSYIGVDFIVEGVESLEQLKELKLLGFKYFQGFFFSRPLSKENFLKYIENTLLDNNKLES